MFLKEYMKTEVLLFFGGGGGLLGPVHLFKATPLLFRALRLEKRWHTGEHW